jgi:hypothetical protein
MHRFLLAALSLAFLLDSATDVACGATIEPNTQIFFGPTGGAPANYYSRVYTDVEGHLTGAFYVFARTSSNKYSLTATTWVPGSWTIDWYLVQAGDVFSKQAIAANKFTKLYEFSTQYPKVTVGTDFYLGVSAGDGIRRRNAFGWMHIQVINNVPTMVENVMSYESLGIIVGTRRLVPEVSSITLGGFSLVGVAAFGRKK